MGDRGERIRLPGGGEVLVRPVEPEDRETLRAGFERLGERSRYLRFLAPKRALTAREITYLTDVDHMDHEAIGALDAATGEGVGVARYIRLPDRPSHAEAAVAGRGRVAGARAGRHPARGLVARAKANGVAHFCATLLVVNHAIRHLFERVGEVSVVRQGDGSMDVDVELPLSGDALRLALREAARRRVSPAE